MSKIFFIGEISGNHNKSIKLVFRLMKNLKEIGADAVKFQTFSADRMAPKVYKKSLIIKKKKTSWHNKSLYELYKKSEIPEKWYPKIFSYAKKINIEVFSSPFSIKDVDFLEKYNLKYYKIASLENTNHSLLKRVAETKKIVFISTGTASKKEIKQCLQILKKNGAKKVIVLKCVTGYPSFPEDYNLKTLIDIKNKFKVDVGISDHTLGNAVAISSVHYNSRYIEKHICIKRDSKGVDSFFSTEVDEFKNMITECNSALKSIGNVNYGNTLPEKKTKLRRRILYFVKNKKKGSVVTTEDIEGLRGGKGVSINLKNKYIGKRITRDIKKYTKLITQHLK